MSSIVPPLLSSYLGMAVYVIGLVISHVKLPEPAVMAQIVVLTTVQAVLMVSGAVIVSAQTTSVRAANLLASFIVIPSALLIQGESIVIFWGNYTTLWWAVLGLSIFSILLVRVGLAHFRREELLGHEIDILNFRWAWKIFVHAFKGETKNIRQWYQQELFCTISRLWIPAVIVASIFLVGGVVGWKETANYRIPLDLGQLHGLNKDANQISNLLPQLTTGSFLTIWWQNIRVMLLALPLGILSFGVLGLIPGFASFGLVGYFMGLLAEAGISPGIYLLGLILPHGIFEIPAAILATAAVLQAGILLATPNTEKSVGEVLIESLADWCKVMLGLVIPLLMISAMVEAWLTPRIALLLLH
jgi:uncharacterized membrane protein SpoIIM required for sporulation